MEAHGRVVDAICPKPFIVSGMAAGLLLQNHIRAVCRVQNSNCRASTAHFPNQSTFRDLHFLSCSSPVVPGPAGEERKKHCYGTQSTTPKEFLRPLTCRGQSVWVGRGRARFTIGFTTGLTLHDLLYDLLRNPTGVSPATTGGKMIKK